MVTTPKWIDLLLLSQDSPAQIWQKIAEVLSSLAQNQTKPDALQRELISPDRLLCESAFELWQAFPTAAPKTSARLIHSCDHVHAFLILDALSLRELPLILQEARRRGIAATPSVSFSEAPSETEAFAQALGATSRSSLKSDGKSKSFLPFGGDCYTDCCMNLPFADVPVPPAPHLLIWHEFPDRLIEKHHNAAEIAKEAISEFTGEGFWKLVDKMRQGRKLVITSDHGYADAEHFSTELSDPQITEFLQKHFGSKRDPAMPAPPERFMPPLFIEHQGCCIVTGQRKWKISGGYPKVCHGGLSLLETASPWIEIESK